LARRILLADDSVTAQNMGRRILTDAGYEVVTVNNGSAALKKIAENKPDLIVLDVYMPGYGGLEVCQRVKENPETKQIPVLLTVGKLEPFKAEEARRVGADSFIIKPFEATELLTVLTRLEDKIVAQPQPQKSGRFAKALAAVEQSDKGDRFGDKETGWKNRLTIPVPHAKPPVAEEVPEIPAPAVGPEIGASASRDREPIETAKPMESHGFERPIPTGLPADITPEEIAAITAAALVFGGQTEPPSAIVEPVVAETATAKTAPVEIKLEKTTTVETTIPNAVVHETVSPEAHFVAAGVSVAETSTGIQPTAPEFSQPEASQIEAVRDAQASESVEAVPEAVAGSETAVAQDQQVQEIPTLEQQPASTEAPAIAASAEVVSEVHASHSTPSVAGDAEVLAAIASLAPSNGRGDSFHSASHGSNGNALASEIVSGPRWIAEPVEVGADEAKLALDQEMDQVLVARASAEAANLAAAAAASEGAVAVAELEQPVVTDAIAAEVIATEVAAAPESISPAIAAETSVAESGTSESATGEAVNTVRESTNGEASATHDQPPVAAEASAYAAAASAGAGLQGSGVQGSGLAGSAASASGLPNVSSEQVAPVEAMSSTSAVPENSAVAQVGSTPQREAELAAAWQNWKQIRESFSGPKPSATPAEVSSEPKPKPEQAAPPPAASTEAVAAPAAEVEEAETDAPETDAPEESTAIASIVDNMLAELRPKLVAEIAKKMNSDKEKKDKEKKKKR
jgi:twitching motility two-component system response regulator PilH